MQPPEVMRRKDVVNATRLSPTTIYNLEKAGEFPRHFLITPRCAAWYKAEVEAWISSRRASNIQPAPANGALRRRTAHKKKTGGSL